MKISCSIVRDLLPLYAEDLVSPDSKKIVETHLCDCPACVKNLEDLRKPMIPVTPPSDAGLKHFRKRMIQRLVFGLMAALFFSITLMVWVWALAIRVEEIPLEKAVIDVTEEDGYVIVELTPVAASGLIWDTEVDGETGQRQQYIWCSKRILDGFFPNDSFKEDLKLQMSRTSSVWYYENGEMICLYGEEEPVMTRWGQDYVLPFVLIMAVVLAVGAWLSGMKWMGYSAVYAASYALADLALTGGNWISIDNGEGLIVLILAIMALLLTVCVSFAWEFIKDPA